MMLLLEKKKNPMGFLVQRKISNQAYAAFKEEKKLFSIQNLAVPMSNTPIINTCVYFTL